MAKRKLGMSIIVLIVAATTMVSGTYAWFLVGGFAELFDLGFDVIEAGGGIEIQGSAGHAYMAEGDTSSVEWGSYLTRDCFNEGEIIAADGHYAPVSSADGTTFTKVGLEGGYFASLTPAVGVDYNELKIKIRSTTTEAVNATLNVAINGNEASNDAVTAARVSVTYNGTTTLYAMDNDGTMAVTTDNIPAATVKDANNNSIIDSSEAAGSVSLVSQSITAMTASAADASKYEVAVPLDNVPGNTSSAEVTIRVWIEGNDPDCTGEKLSSKHLSTKITFGSTSEEEVV